MSQGLHHLRHPFHPLPNHRNIHQDQSEQIFEEQIWSHQRTRMVVRSDRNLRRSPLLHWTPPPPSFIPPLLKSHCFCRSQQQQHHSCCLRSELNHCVNNKNGLTEFGAPRETLLYCNSGVLPSIVQKIFLI